MTKFNCPYCKKELDFMEIKGDQDLVAIIKMQSVFGKYSFFVWAYAELFGIMPLKAKTQKLRLILEEMKNLFQTEEFIFNKRHYKINQTGIVEALNIVVHKHFDDPLKNHNYLKQVMVGIAEKLGKDESRQAEKNLRKKEEDLRHPQGRIIKEEQHEERPPRMTAEQIAENKQRLKDLTDRIG